MRAHVRYVVEDGRVDHVLHGRYHTVRLRPVLHHQRVGHVRVEHHRVRCHEQHAGHHALEMLQYNVIITEFVLQFLRDNIK